MFAFEVTLLTGRYVATAYNDRMRGEWPPHPARLFSALVAAHYDTTSPAAEERRALEWLEQQGPPAIRSSGGTERQVATVYVPVNDTTVIGDLHPQVLTITEAEDELEAARHAVASVAAGATAKVVRRLERDIAKAEKRVEQARAALSKRVATAVAGGKTTKKSLEDAPKLLPDHRERQARTFPSVTPESPTVTYQWDLAEVLPNVTSVLDRLSARVVRLGHSSSLVSVRVIDDPHEPTLEPDDLGSRRLRVVRAGQLEALDRAFELHRETEPRQMPAVFQRYAPWRPDSDTTTPTSLFESEDWLVLRRTGGPACPTSAAAGIAKTVRRAMMKHADQPVPEIISGYGAPGVPSERPHMAVVPLPFVGHPRADGHILGVALVLPRGVTREERRAAYMAVRRWEDENRAADEEVPAIRVYLGPAGSLMLTRWEDEELQIGLRTRTWSVASRSWLSATPIALDRNPGDLHSRSPEKLASAVAAARETIAAGCERIGLPRPEQVEILPAAPLAGAAKARDFSPFPDQPRRTRRVLTHVALWFTGPVEGPILLGAGRYHGVGLFRPMIPDG